VSKYKDTWLCRIFATLQL